MIKFLSKQKTIYNNYDCPFYFSNPQGNSNSIYAQNNNTNQNGSWVASNNILTEPTIDSISIPISKGYVNGNISYFVTTDASEKGIVSSVTNTTKFSINYALSLAGTPQSARQQGYVFTNGVKGEGPFGFQLSVASATPANEWI